VNGENQIIWNARRNNEELLQIGRGKKISDSDNKKPTKNMYVYGDIMRGGSLQELTPPLFALSQCQSQVWIKEEGDANHHCFDIVSLNNDSTGSISSLQEL